MAVGDEAQLVPKIGPILLSPVPASRTGATATIRADALRHCLSNRSPISYYSPDKSGVPSPTRLRKQKIHL